MGTISRETSLYPLNPSGHRVVSNACHLSWGGRHHCIRSKRGSASVRSSPRVQKRFSALSERASLCLSLYRASFSSVHHLARGLLIGCTEMLCSRFPQFFVPRVRVPGIRPGTLDQCTPLHL